LIAHGPYINPDLVKRFENMEPAAWDRDYFYYTDAHRLSTTANKSLLNKTWAVHKLVVKT
jgi:hypothetical protein